MRWATSASLKTGSMRRMTLLGILKYTVSYSPISNKTQALIRESNNNNILKSSTSLAAHPSRYPTHAYDKHWIHQTLSISNHHHHKPHLTARTSEKLIMGLIDLQQWWVQHLHFFLDTQDCWELTFNVGWVASAGTGIIAAAYNPTEIWETYDAVDT